MTNPGISEKAFGSYEGKQVTAYTLTNVQGMQVSVINYGATIIQIIIADKNDVFANVINGFNSLEEYISNSHQYIGCIAGRYCNRIAQGRFQLDGKEYVLATNNNGNSLHGGIKGFNRVFWHIKKDSPANSIELNYLSADGEEGFPGNLQVTVRYTLSDDNTLAIDYTATTDQTTIVNLTSHCYFNLSGEHQLPILDHALTIYADHYTPVNASLIPTGEILPVKNTALDFTSAKKIAQDITDIGGYDHNLVLHKKETDEITGLAPAAFLYEPLSGRFMKMFTTEPAVQFYSGNLLPGPDEQAGLCLEAQHYPDSPNQPGFPSTVLKPGETYKQKTLYQFSIKAG